MIILLIMLCFALLFLTFTEWGGDMVVYSFYRHFLGEGVYLWPFVLLFYLSYLQLALTESTLLSRSKIVQTTRLRHTLRLRLSSMRLHHK